MFKAKSTGARKFISALLVVACLVAIVPNRVGADTVQQLQDRSSSLQSDIEANKTQIIQLQKQAESLEGKILELSLEIDNANREITLTEVKLEELRVRLEEAKAELERQKDLLKASLRALYQKRDASTVELLVASDSFADFINEQEYLDRLQSSVKDSAEKVVDLKRQIEAEKVEQENLLARQQEQKAILAAKQQEQQTILDQTKGEEAKYQEIVAGQQKELEAAEAELAAMLAASNVVSLGPVKRGEVIGKVGSTGYSTGPHIHFQTYYQGSTKDPYLGNGTLINGYTWPLPNSPGAGYVTTLYGYIHCSNYTGCANGGDYSVWHSGLDISSSAGEPVIAAADGNIIFRGCNNGLGFVVVIDHGDGWQTWYPHMITPEGQVSGYCQ